MKRILVIIQYAILNAIPYAIGYGLGEFIGDLLDLPQWANYVFAYVFLLIAGALGAKFLRWYESRHHRLGARIFIVSLLVYVVFDLLTDYVFGKSLNSSLLDNLSYELGIGLIAYCVARVMLFFKSWRARRVFGSGEQSVRETLASTEETCKGGQKCNKEISSRYNHDLAVKCTTGIFVGEKNKGVLSFKGIPYAQPPVGALRWKAPRPLPVSSVVRQAVHFSPICPQPRSIISELNSLPRSEDCLTLNVWASCKSDSAKRPVVVFLHGGDLTYGCSSLPVLDGSNFVRQNPDTLFVSLNFRQGVFGVMDFTGVPGGEEYAESTDLPLLDQLAALRWLHENVAAFHGDPENVTLCGNDTGGVSAAILATRPEAHRLFQRVILLSVNNTCYGSAEKAGQRTAQFLEHLHVRTMEELVQLPTEVLLAAQEKLMYVMTDFVAGRGMVPANLLDAYRQGAAKGIDLICCSTENTSSLYVVDLGLQRAREFFLKLSEEMRSMLLPEHFRCIEEYTQLARESGVALPEGYFFDYLFTHSFQLALCHAQASNQQSARYFRWCVGSPVQAFGAFSNIELPFILGTLNSVEKYGIVGDKRLGQIIQCSLAHFAQNGNPDLPMDTVCHNDYLHWPEITAEKTPALVVCDERLFVDESGIGKRSLPVEELLTAYPDLPIRLVEKVNLIYQELLREIRK